MKRTVIAALAAGAMLALGAAGTAGAAVHPVPDSLNAAVLFTGPANAGGISSGSAVSPCAIPLASCTDSMAGYYTDSFARQFSQVDGTFTLNSEAEGVGVSQVHGVGGYTGTTHINGAIGLQLCNESNGEAAQIGAVYLGNGVFAVGYLTGQLHGLVANPCGGGGVLGGASLSTTFVSLATVPVGSVIQAQIKHDGFGVLFTAALAGGIASYTEFDAFGWFFPNEAGAGLQADTTGLSAPAVNDLTDFTGVAAVSNGQSHGFAAWNAVTVEGSQDGQGPALLAPSPLTPSVSGCVWHPGHRVYWGPRHDRHYRWVHGYNVCTGQGPSSFSVDAGTPVS